MYGIRKPAAKITDLFPKRQVLCSNILQTERNAFALERDEKGLILSVCLWQEKEETCGVNKLVRYKYQK
jgi:hypothetical protein